MASTAAAAKLNRSHLEEMLKMARAKVREMESLIERIDGLLEKSSRNPRPSPLDNVQEIAESGSDLRVGNGNISAERIAKLYGISLSQLATWLGRTRQTVSKTPDADSLQAALAFFERVARLRLILKSDEDFRKWLRSSKEPLDGKSPLQMMAKGKWQAMADWVDDILTGAPA